jgi:hypothetical protein
MPSISPSTCIYHHWPWAAASQPQPDRRPSRPQLRHHLLSRLSLQSSGWFAQTYHRLLTLPLTSPHFPWPPLSEESRTDCTIPERDPCASKQQLHFEPGRPFLPSPMMHAGSFGVSEAWWRMPTLDPLRSLLLIDTYLSMLVLLHRVFVSPYPTLSQSPIPQGVSCEPTT